MRNRFFIVSSALVAGFFVFILAAPLRAGAAAYSTPVYDQWTGGLATQTLTKAGSPYLILSCANSTLPAGNTLTIEPGAVIKFDPPRGCGLPAQLLVYGNLVVRGTAEEPAIFTSWADDAAAGDTNGDGSLSEPQAGDWGRITLGSSASSSVQIDHAIFRYGGDAALGMVQVWSPISSLRLDNLEIASSTTYGLTTFVPLEIHNSRFHGNRGAALNADPSSGLILPQVDATNNWWGSDSGPRVSANPGGIGQTFTGNVLFDPWIGKSPSPLEGEGRGEGIDPVIIIPGILGSAQKNGLWVIDPIFHTYDDLIDTLKANGYTAGRDLFTFPYDWREGNVTSSLLLRDRINEVQAICQCAKVDLVAHSMGGLVARQYIQSNYYEGDVDQLIFLGTPHLGAPKGYLAWEAGILKDQPSRFNPIDPLFKFVFLREAQKAGFSSIFDYVRKRPILSVQNLLPIYDYVREKVTAALRPYPNNYPANPFLENLNNTISNLFSSGVKLTNIVGDSGASSTLNSVRVVESSALPLWEHGYPEGFDGSTTDRGLERGEGDDTVPSASGEYIGLDLNRTNVSHLGLPDENKQLIFKKLTGKDPSATVEKWRLLNFKLIIIKILSPVDVVIVASDGKRVGKDFQTGQEVNEIDGAFYSGFLTDDEYVTIPNPLNGEYKIQTQGTDTGNYTVAVGYISGEDLVEREFTGQTKPNLVTELNLSVNNTASGTLELNPVDAAPPEITISSPEAKDYLRSEVLPINFAAFDAGSGVSSQEARFDDRIVNNGETIDLFFEKLGVHRFSIRASDFLGNTTSTAINFRVVATPVSAISDIERAYSLGWITKNGVKEKLIRALEKIIRQDKEVTPKTFKGFIHTLEEKHPKYINDQAYYLLKEDISWLLGN